MRVSSSEKQVRALVAPAVWSSLDLVQLVGEKESFCPKTASFDKKSLVSLLAVHRAPPTANATDDEGNSIGQNAKERWPSFASSTILERDISVQACACACSSSSNITFIDGVGSSIVDIGALVCTTGEG